MYYNYIKILVVILIAWIGYPSMIHAQIVVDSGDTEPYTPINIIENVFLGTGLEVNNIQYDGLDQAVGVFNNGSAYIGLEHGIILSTGFAATASEQNDENTNAKGGTTNTSISDSDLQSVAGLNSEILDIARYEITFVPESDTIRFRYVFASEEYPEFVCSNFNDVFGFFISGPNPSGGNYNALNIARVPDPADPTGTTFLNNNVAINSVNSGSSGTLGNIDVANCSGMNGSLDFSQYYNDVLNNQFPVYNAYLDVFIAQAAVVPCQEYTIKLAIGDVKDQDFDSAVFLEAASFYSPTLDVVVSSSSPDGSIAEGCSPVELEVNIPFPLSTDTEVSLAPLSEGQFPDQARNNDDFIFPTEDIIIPAGSTSTTLSIQAIQDNNPELDQFIYLELERSSCRRDTVKIRIVEDPLPDFSLPQDTAICANDILRLNPEFDGELLSEELQEPMIFRNENQLIIDESNKAFSSFINVQGVTEDNVGNGIFAQLCIDTLVSRDMTDVEIFVVGPQGQLLELSTNNGSRNEPALCNNSPNSPVCIESLSSTCFTLNASDNINNGNSTLGPVFVGNENYVGQYLPEGNWDNFFVDDASANGVWELIIKSDSVTVEDVANQNSFLGAWSIHFNAEYSIEYSWSPFSNIACTDCAFTFVSPDQDVTYKLNVTDSYGCTSFDDIRITVLPVTETPEEVDCVGLSPSSVQISWTDVGDEVESYQVGENISSSLFETEETTFIFEGLEADTEHSFSVSAFNGQCYTAPLIFLCSTLPCAGIGPSFGNISTIPPTCNGRNDGSIFAQATSSNGGEVTFYLENLSNTTGEFNFLTEGDYVIRIVDEFGCSSVQDVTIPPAQDLEIELLGEGVSCVGASDAIAEISIVDEVNPPYTILWQNQSEEFVQEDLGMGTYFFTITDGGGCRFDKSIQIADPEPLTFETIDAQLPRCFGDEGSIELVMAGGTGAYTYEWEDTSENSAFVSFEPGEYSVTVTDANDCSISTEIEIEERLQINLVPDTLHAACIGQLSEEIELEIIGGAGDFEVLWGGTIEGIEVEDVPVGFYELTITDQNNCTIIDSLELLNFPNLIVEFDVRETECFNICDGILSVAAWEFSDGSVPSPSIIWENGLTDEAIGNLCGNEFYDFTITDDFGCKHIDSVFLASPPEIFINPDTIQILECFGDENGSFSIDPSGGAGDLTIEWSSNILNLQNNVASELGAGLYSVTVTDTFQGKTCTTDYELALVQPEELLFDATVDNIDCFGEMNGEIMGVVEGGVAPYDISWSNGSTSDTLDNLVSGTYEVSIVDANGCELTDSYEIDQPEEALVVDFEAFETLCFQTSTGSIDIFASGGTMPYNVLLDSINFFDNLSVTGLEAGSYDLIVIDARGCEIGFEDIVIEETDEVFVSLPEDTVIVFGSSITLEFMTNATNLTEFSWTTSSPEAVLSCTDCPNPVIDPVVADFFVELVARDANCKYETNKYYIFEQDNSFVEVPTAFSPNGDFRNDLLRVYGMPGVMIMNWEIFDRWGEVMFSEAEFEILPKDTPFEASSGAISWDGTFNGKEVDSGVYVWKIQLMSLSGDIEFLEGNVTLLR